MGLWVTVPCAALAVGLAGVVAGHGAASERAAPVLDCDSAITGKGKVKSGRRDVVVGPVRLVAIRNYARYPHHAEGRARASGPEA